MTESYPPASPPLPPGEPLAPLPPLPEDEQPGTADVVRDQAADLKDSGVEAGQHAVGVAREQASQVAAEAARQGQNLLSQAQQQAGDQVAQGQQRLASQLLSLGDELSSMADGSAQHGTAAGLARQAATRVRGVGQWLDDRTPAQVIDDVQAFARRKPGVFLALAAGAGLVAGRLTRGLSSAGDDDADAPGPVPAPGLQPESAASWTDPAAPAADPLDGAATAAYQPGTDGTTAYPVTPADPAYQAEPAFPAGQTYPVEEAFPAEQPFEAVPLSQAPGDQADSGLVAADDGTAVPLVDGLPAAPGGSAWDVDPQADEQGTLGRHQAGSGGAL
jgi:hypothetical protein